MNTMRIAFLGTTGLLSVVLGLSGLSVASYLLRPELNEGGNT